MRARFFLIAALAAIPAGLLGAGYGTCQDPPATAPASAPTETIGLDAAGPPRALEAPSGAETSAASTAGAQTSTIPFGDPTLAEPRSLHTLGPDALGRRELGAAEGEEVEPYRCHDREGQPVDREALLEIAPAMVVFYRGGWCPYSTFQIKRLGELAARFEEVDVTPIRVSVDRVEGAAKAGDHYEIPFPMWSDPDHSMHDAFGITLELDPATLTAYREQGQDLEAWSGRTHHKVAASGAFLVDREGLIRWVHVSRDHERRPTATQLLGEAIRWHVEMEQGQTAP